MTGAIDKKTTSVVLGGKSSARVQVGETAEIAAAGDMVLRAVETGPAIEELWGSDEHEVIVKISADWKDSVLLTLIRERFATVAAASEWLQARGIPFSASRWT